MLAPPLPAPKTDTVATPELLVADVGALKPRIAASVAAKDTVTPGIATPNTSLIVALRAAFEPPTISADPPELLKAMLAPTIFTWLLTGLAVQALQDAVRVAMRFVWSDETATIVTVAPVSVVTTDDLAKMTPFVAARSIFAPAIEAFPLVKAKIVNVKEEVPSALSALALELILIVATVEFDVAAGAVAPLLGAPALPPPPPQAARTAASNVLATYFKKFIFNFLPFNLHLKTIVTFHARPQF